LTQFILWPSAQADVDAALAWYDRRASGLARRLLDELTVAFDRITGNPFQFPLIEEPVRRTLLHKFPYSVYYLIEEEIVVVIAVVHQRRHPDTWKRGG